MKKNYFLALLLSLFMLSANAQVQSFQFKSSGATFKLHSETEATGDITIAPQGGTATSIAIDDDIAITADTEYTITGMFTQLDCSENQLTSLNVSELTNITLLNCDNNLLTSLNVSGLEHLLYLDCFNNPLTYLNISGLKSLTNLYCQSDQLIDIISNNSTKQPNDFFGLGQKVKITMKADNNGGFISKNTYSLMPSHSISINAPGVISTFENGYFKLSEPTTEKITFTTDLGWDEEQYIKGTLIFEIEEQPQYFTFISKSSTFRLDGQTEVDGNIMISPEVSTSSESDISTIVVNKSYNITPGTVYTVTGNFSILDCLDNSIDSINVTNLTDLTELWCYENNLKTLDVSGLTNLEELWCSDNHLTSIQLDGLTNLKTIDCNTNQLKNIDFSGLPAIKEIICHKNQFSVCALDSIYSSLPEKQAAAKATIVVADINEHNDIINQSRTNLAKEKNWKVLRFKYDYTSYEEIINEGPYGCEQEESLSFTFKSAGTTFKLHPQTEATGDITIAPQGGTATSLTVGTALTITPNTEYTVTGTFKKLDCSDNQLTSLDISEQKSLVRLDCSKNLLSSLDVLASKKLLYLDCEINKLSSLDVSGLVDLLYLDCTDNQLFDIVKDASVESPGSFYGEEQKLTVPMKSDGNNGYISTNSYNVTNGHSLTVNSSDSTITFENGYFKSTMPINGEKAFTTDLGWDEEQYLQGTLIFELEEQPQYFTFISKSSTFRLDGQTEVDGNIMISPEVSTSSESDISTIVVNKSYNITPETVYTVTGNFSILDCLGNSIDSINVTNLTDLTELWCYENNLKTLDVSGLTNLEELWCSDNHLTSIQLDGLTNLKTIDCNTNQLKNIDFSGLPAIKEIICHKNQFSVCALDSIYSSLPEQQASAKATITVADINEHNDIINQSRTYLAKEKNWKVMRFKYDYASYEEIINEGPYGCEQDESPSFTFKSAGTTFKLHPQTEATGDITIAPQGGTATSLTVGTALTITPNTEYTVTGTFKKLDCSDNQLTSLDISEQKSLVRLDCSKNLLSSLDVLASKKLLYLDCEINKLSSLDVSGLVDLVYIDCTDNQLFDIVKDASVESPGVFYGEEQKLTVPMKSDGNNGYISTNSYNLTNGHSLTVNSSDSTIIFENGYFKSTTPINGEKAFTTDLNWETGNLSGMITFNTPSTPSTTTITGAITLIGKEIEADQFKFELLDEENVVAATAKNDAEGIFTFTITHDSQGVYNYTLKEVNDGQEGYTYDTKVYSVEVAVSLNTTTNILTSVVTVKDGDTTVSTPKFENSYSSLGVDLEIVNEYQITIYPNPVQNELHIESAETVISVSLFNMSGKLLIKQPVNNTHFSQQMSQLQSGIYLLKVQTGSGYKNVKIIKK